MRIERTGNEDRKGLGMRIERTGNEDRKDWE